MRTGAGSETLGTSPLTRAPSAPCGILQRNRLRATGQQSRATEKFHTLSHETYFNYQGN